MKRLSMFAAAATGGEVSRTRFANRPIAVAACLLGLAAAGAGQVGQVWVARYNGPGNSNDAAKALAVDTVGNVYVTGWSVGAGTGVDYATIKYDSPGNQLWERRYSGPGSLYDAPADLVVDDAGNAYVTGQSHDPIDGYHFATIKYDTNGNQEWLAQSVQPGTAVAMAVDNAGNVYVTGTGYPNPYYFTIKYDSDGNELWTATWWNGRVPADLAVDAVGNVYVTGSDGGLRYITIKYDTNGNKLWEAVYTGFGSINSASALAVDLAGNVYVTGYSDKQNNRDCATIKYDPKGNQIWESRYNSQLGNQEDIPRDLAVDAAGNVYITGEAAGGYLTVKYDTNGNQLWADRYAARSSSTATALAVDAAGNVYVTGQSLAWFFTWFDYATIKYDADGNQLWVRRYTDGDNSWDVARALAVDAAGNVYVTGSLSSDTDYGTIKYAPTTNAPPSSFAVTRGSLKGGGLADLLQSDDARMTIQAPAKDPEIQLVVEGTAPQQTATFFLFRLEASYHRLLPRPDGIQTIELYNYQEDRWEQADQRAPAIIDRVVEVFFNVNAHRFIQPDTRTIRARISWTGRSGLPGNLTASIDQTIWEIVP